MSVKISQLPSASEVLGSDVAPSVQYGTTKKFSMTTLANYLLNTFNSLSLGGTARTVKSAIDAIHTSLSSLLDKVGNVTMGTTATTITGAIAEHEGDITTIDASLSVQSSGQITPTASNVTSSSANLIFYKIGKIGVLYYSFKWDSVTANTEYTLCNISSYGTPTTKFNFTVANQGGHPFLVQVYTNGNVTFYANAHTDLGFVRGTLVFPLA